METVNTVDLVELTRRVGALHADFQAALNAKADHAGRVVAAVRILAWSMRKELQRVDGFVEIPGFPLVVGGDEDSAASSWWAETDPSGAVEVRQDADAVDRGVLLLVRSFRDLLSSHVHGAKGRRVEQIRTEAERLGAVAILLEGLVRS